MSSLSLRLPRLVESDPRAPRLLQSLTTHTRPLWHEGELEVPSATLGPEVVAALRSAHNEGRVVRGLESAERNLFAEERGLRLADRQGDVPRTVRISRLLLLADDGAERFYRHVETLLRRHGSRLMAIRLDVHAEPLGELLFGPGSRARLLMLTHKEAVSSVLLALAEQGEN